MGKSSEASPSCNRRSRSGKPNLRSSKAQCEESVQLSTNTPEKLEQRTRNRGVALSISDIRKVAEGLQDRNKQCPDTTSSQPKTARRQIVMPSPLKPKAAAAEPFKLPQKYEILGEFFDNLVHSIELLRLRRSKPSFRNISPMIERLTDRRFTRGHLAQLKFMLPEAIAIKRLLVPNERTRCMEPDLHVAINPDAVESDLPERGTVSLKKLFRARLRDFYKSHPEGVEIPEETLPEPFNRPKQDPLLDTSKTPSSSFSTETLSDASAAFNQKPAVASHMSQAFKRRFSLKSKGNGADNAQQKFPSDSSQPSTFPVSGSIVSSEICPTIHAPERFTSSGSTPATPCKAIEYAENKDGSLKSSDAMSTPAKLVSTPAKQMSGTLPPHKRYYMSPDDNSTSSTNKLVRRPPRSRSLKFDTPVKSEDDISDILPDNLVQSIREKERIAMEERDPAISQAKKRQKIIASLPKLFNMIHLLFHSIRRSVITKEELISKIISNHCDIVDRSEIEEQMHLLLELAPEWISEKLGSSEDLLICINKMTNPDTIRASLEEAK